MTGFEEAKSIFPSAFITKSTLLNQMLNFSPEATVTLVPVWKRDVPKRGILKSLVSHVLNFKSWIKLIYDRVDTVGDISSWTLGRFRCIMALFQRAWRRVKVLSRPGSLLIPIKLD